MFFQWFLERIRKWWEGAVPETALIQPGVEFEYLINDSTTPDLIRKLFIPPPPDKMRILVHGLKMREQSLVEGNTEELAANCYITLVNSLKATQRIAVEFRKPLPHWAACERLSVFPCAGKDFNAYYNRAALKFFYDQDPVTRKRVYTASSSDVVAHELGHAILDSIRPDFWSVQALEIWAFHESFADINAMWHILQYEEILERMLKETDGNLAKPNVVTRLAEEMGNAIYHLTRGQYGYKPGALRDATNTFKYVTPERLPKDAPNDQLAAECHSFGRIFMGAWYQILVGIYNKEVKSGMSQMEALVKARDVSYEYLLRAVHVAPRVARYHDAVSRVMLAEDNKKGAPYQEILQEVFANRNLLAKRLKAMSGKTWDSVRSELKAKDEVIQKQDYTLVRMPGTTTIKLADYASGEVSMLSANGIDLANVELEIATDSYYEFGPDGTLLEEILPEEEEAVETARACVFSIQAAGNIGPSPELMWEVKDGKLVRTLIE